MLQACSLGQSQGEKPRPRFSLIPACYVASGEVAEARRHRRVLSQNRAAPWSSDLSW